MDKKDKVDKMQENKFVYLDIMVDEEKVGRVVIELLYNIAPKTCENFRALCTGEKGVNEDGIKLHYKDCLFHKVVSQCLIQGGDITNNDGTGGDSIYGKFFEDESFEIPHSEPGIVGMANKGLNSNNSQFYITTDTCAHLDKINVVFGKVRKGLNIIREMYKEASVDAARPKVNCKIENCGEFKSGEPWDICEKDGSCDIYPPWPDDWDIEENNAINYEEVVTNIKNSGNAYFHLHNYVDSDRKYKKTLRYLDWMKTTNKSNNCTKLLRMKLNTLLNLAAVRLHRNKPCDVIKLCSEVLEIDKKNVKAYFRRGQAYMKVKEYDNSLIDLKRAKSLFPTDKKILSEYQSVKKSKQSYLKYERELFSKMLHT